MGSTLAMPRVGAPLGPGGTNRPSRPRNIYSVGHPVSTVFERCRRRGYAWPKCPRLAVGHVSSRQYRAWYEGFPESVQQELQESWGDPPGNVYRTEDSLAIAGLQLGNVFVGLQPPRGFGEHPISIYHSPDLTPTHHYIAYYRWIRDVFQADAMVHVGKHGTLEWLPGKGIGLSEACYPEVALQDLPLPGWPPSGPTCVGRPTRKSGWRLL